MKKTLLFIAAAIIGFSASAQINLKAVSISKSIKTSKLIDANQTQASCLPLQESNMLYTKGTNLISATALGTSYNLFSVLSENQNQVVYNPDINTVAFIHRQNNGDAGGSGVIAFDYSTDGGTTWVLDTHLTPAIITQTTGAVGNYGRYPNITIYNPAGNTNPDDAFAVGAGPLLCGTNGNPYGWGMQYACSYKMDGSKLDEKYFATTTDTADWAPRGMCSNENGVWFVTANNEFDNDLSNPAKIGNTEYYVYKGVLNTTTNTFDYTVVDTLKPKLYVTNIATPPAGFGFSYNMAFSTDGQTGYVVILGIKNSTIDSIVAPHPLVYKSTDAGASWNALPDFDFATITNIADSLYPATFNEKIPYFESVDIVVDKNGALHTFGVIGSASTSHIDSIGYLYGHPLTKFLYHTTTSDGVTWTADFIDYVYNNDGEFHYTGETSPVTLDSRPQAATSPDGSKLFFTWLKSENPNDTTWLNNEEPNLCAISYDVNNAMWTVKENKTLGNPQIEGLLFFATMAPITKFEGNENELQIVFVDLSKQGNTPDAGAQVEYFYLSGVKFVGVEDNFVNKMSFDVYPNPANSNVTIGYELEENANVEISISNLLGQTVITGNSNKEFVGAKTTTLNVSNLEAGIYFVNVKVNNVISTKKLVIE